MQSATSSIFHTRLFKRMALFIASSALCTATAAQAAYPENAITMLVPFGPGGTSDIMARILEKHMHAELGQSIVVDNRAGAGGAIGMGQLKRAQADGYTIGLSVIGPEVLQPAIRDTGYSHEDFDHVCRTYSVPLMMMVPQDSPFNSLADVMEYAKKNPDMMTYGSSGKGTLLHLSMEMLLSEAGVKALHVPYKSSGEMVTALMGKHIMLFAETPTVSRQYKLKPLAIFSESRHEAFPDVPTVKESGWPIEASIWGGLIAPKGLPGNVLAKLEKSCENALKSEGYRQDAARLDTPAEFLNAADFADFAKQQSGMYNKLISDLGLAEKQ